LPSLKNALYYHADYVNPGWNKPRLEKIGHHIFYGDNHALLATVRSQWLPNAVTVWGEPVDSPLWAGREPGMAYVCRNHECLLPARTEQELRDRIATSFSGE
jgi:uncharacterized protein YyaL (SSP411 family)